MLKFKQSPGRTPNGGHHLIDRGTVFEGATPQEVAAKVAEFRLNNGYPAGNPIQEIVLYYAQIAPFMLEESGEEWRKQAPSGFELSHRWLIDQYSKGFMKLLPDEELSPRETVCMKCQHKNALPSTMAGGDVKHRLFLLTQGRGDPALGFCSHHNWVTGLAALQPCAECPFWPLLASG
jgi:hypothetical protein